MHTSTEAIELFCKSLVEKHCKKGLDKAYVYEKLRSTLKENIEQMENDIEKYKDDFKNEDELGDFYSDLFSECFYDVAFILHNLNKEDDDDCRKIKNRSWDLEMERICVKWYCDMKGIEGFE